ncbi:Uncharacterised protein [Bordetella pertussis]|nr:Uncharacterised protein [Bordetella pertussis]
MRPTPIISFQGQPWRSIVSSLALTMKNREPCGLYPQGSLASASAWSTSRCIVSGLVPGGMLYRGPATSSKISRAFGQRIST